MHHQTCIQSYAMLAQTKRGNTYAGGMGGALSLCLLFLNQLLTCVNVSPVFLASPLFSSGVGYLYV